MISVLISAGIIGVQNTFSSYFSPLKVSNKIWSYIVFLKESQVELLSTSQ